MEMFFVFGLFEGWMIVFMCDFEFVCVYNFILLLCVDVMDVDIYVDDVFDVLFLVFIECGGEYCVVVNFVGVL